jgi:hypothetical protein
MIKNLDNVLFIKINTAKISINLKIINYDDGEIFYNINKYVNKNNINNYKIEADINSNENAMYMLGLYYQEKEIYTKMIKYYLMSIKKGNTLSMRNLALYYYDINDYDNMIRYYLMAIEHNNSIAMDELVIYYGRVKDYENMIKYCKIMIDNNNFGKIQLLIDHYMTLQKHDDVLYYFWIALNNDCCDIVHDVIKYLIKHNFKLNDIFEIYAVCIEIYNDIDFFNEIKDILNLNYRQIAEYFGKRYMKKYNLINKYIQCIYLSDLIIDY